MNVIKKEKKSTERQIPWHCIYRLKNVVYTKKRKKSRKTNTILLYLSFEVCS